MTVCDLESQLESFHLEGCDYNIYYRSPEGQLYSIDLVCMSHNGENIILE